MGGDDLPPKIDGLGRPRPPKKGCSGTFAPANAAAKTGTKTDPSAGNFESNTLPYSTRVIMDCTELFIETPSSLNIQSATYSSYKHHNTFKALVGISPTGACIFVSDLYTGGISDKEITNVCGILDKLEHGDSVMADKGFDISYECFVRGTQLNIPPFVRGSQLSKHKVICTRKIASLRVHVV